MSNRNRREYLENGCSVKASEEANVTVPVAVRAFADIGDVYIGCNGSALVTRNSLDAPGTPGATSNFTISQRLQVDIPVAFGAEAEVGEGHVFFASGSKEDC